MNCAFCEFDEVKERIIFKDNLVFCFPTYQPIVPGHLLVCPIRHVATIQELTPDELQAMIDMTDKLKSALQKSFEFEGFNYAWNEGATAGQTVPHLHLHIVPRKEGDTGIYEYEPRKFLYRPGSRAVSEQEELIAVAELIKKNI